MDEKKIDMISFPYTVLNHTRPISTNRVVENSFHSAKPS
jgi:hypothetical protein